MERVERIPILKTQAGDTDAVVAPPICFQESTAAPTSPYKEVFERKEVGEDDITKKNADTDEEPGTCCCATGKYFECSCAESCKQLKTIACTLICFCCCLCCCGDS